MRQLLLCFPEKGVYASIVWETHDKVVLHIFEKMPVGHRRIHCSDDWYGLLCYGERALSIAHAGIRHGQWEQYPGLAHQPVRGIGCQRRFEVFDGLLILACQERLFPSQLQPAGPIKLLDQCNVVKVLGGFI